MYCTTDQKMIEAEIKTCRRIIAKYDGQDDLCMAHADALSSAKATIAMYADLLDENDKVAEYHDVPQPIRITACIDATKATCPECGRTGEYGRRNGPWTQGPVQNDTPLPLVAAFVCADCDAHFTLPIPEVGAYVLVSVDYTTRDLLTQDDINAAVKELS